MATVQELRRVVDIRGRSSGVKEATADLKKLDKAYTGVSVESAKLEKATLSVDRQLGALQRRVDPTFRATERLAKAERTLSAAQAQGLITLKRKNELLALTAANSNRATASTTRLAAAQRSLAAVGLGGGLAIGGILAARAALNAFFEKSIEQQKAVAQLEQAIRSTGGAAGVTADELTGMASALQGVTTYGDEAIIASQAMLLTFTKIGGEILPEVQERILDVSTAMHVGLREATIQVGKALNDPIKGMAGLSRAGIQFTDAQKDQVKALVESGRQLEAQRLLLHELETQFGGSARAARDTLGGAVLGLQNAFGDLFEVSGQGSANLTASINGLSATLSDPGTIAAIQAFGGALFDAISAAISLVRNLIDNLNNLIDLISSIGSAVSNSGVGINVGPVGLGIGATTPVVAETVAGFDKLKKSASDYTKALEITIPVTANAAAATGNLGKSLTKVADIPTPTLRGDAIKRLDDNLKNATVSARGFADAFVSGLIQGDGIVGALASSVGSLSSRLGDAASGLVSKLGGGGLGGSLLGGLAGGVVGSLASGLSSIVSKIFGGGNKELEEARDAWKGMSEDLRDFRADLNGGTGSLASAIDANRDEFHEFARAARKAGKDISDVKDELKAFERGLRQQFKATFDGVISGLKAGEGLSGSYAQGVKDAQELTATLLDFVKDAKTAFGRGPELRQAQRVARNAALESLSGGADVGEYTAEYNRLQGAADTLKKTLKDLGLSAKQAGKAVKAELNTALANLRSDFAEDLTSRINDAIGLGYNNDVAELIAERVKLLEDAATIGADPTLVQRYFQVQAQEIIDSAELTGEAFDDLIKQFPQLAGVVNEFTESAVMSAREIRDATNQAGGSIADYLVSITSGSQSTLSPADRLNAAEAQYNAQLALAQSGDFDAQGSIAKYAEDFRQAARDMYASSTEYQVIFDQITQQLLALPAVQAADDPVVVELRTVLAGILDGLDAHAIMLTSAINAGPAATAAAMAPLFDSIDIDGSGGISFVEMQTLFAGLASDAQLQAVIDTLDSNGDGQLSQLELIAAQSNSTASLSNQIKASSAAIQTNTGATVYEMASGDGIKKWSKATAQVVKAFAEQTVGWLPVISARLYEIADFTASGKEKPVGGEDKSFYKQAEKGKVKLNPGQNPFQFSFAHGGVVAGYVDGGVVGNGIYGRDSVLAQYAGGGMIGLAGGEGILTAAATARLGGTAAIDAINRAAGRPTSNDNGQYFMTQNRVLMAGFRAMVDSIESLDRRLAAIESRASDLVVESRRRGRERPKTKVA